LYDARSVLKRSQNIIAEVRAQQGGFWRIAKRVGTSWTEEPTR